MSDTRVSKHGFAWGWYGSAGPTSANYLLPPQDTTPDVTTGTFFVTNNTSAVTYTYFDVTGQGGQVSSAHNGKLIILHFRDANTTVQNGTNIWLTDTQGALPANSTLALVYYNSAWVEQWRADVDQTPQAPSGAVRSVTYGFSGTAPGSLLNVTTADRIYINATAASSVIWGFSGGRSNQAIDLVNLGTFVAFLAQSAGVLQLPGTSTILMSGSGTYRFVTQDGVLWSAQAGLASP